MIPYEPDFYSQEEADELFEFIKTLPFVRPDNKRNRTSRLRRLSFPGYSPPLSGHHRSSRYSVSGTVDDAPEPYKRLADAITAYQVSQGLPNPCNYLSTIGYLTDDHMNFHQHREDKKWEDQTVYVLSLGAVHPVAIRTLGCTDKSQYEVIHPKHGSLYVLPSSYNLTHEHAVLEGIDYSYGGLRIGINCKHIEAEFTKVAGGKRKPSAKPFVREPGPPRIYNIKSGKFPKDAVYVGRKYGSWPTTPFGNHKRLNGDAWKAEVARLMASPEFHKEIFEYLGGPFENLGGRDLLCWCSPKEMPRCHARVWLELANAK